MRSTSLLITAALSLFASSAFCTDVLPAFPVDFKFPEFKAEDGLSLPASDCVPLNIKDENAQTVFGIASSKLTKLKQYYNVVHVMNDKKSEQKAKQLAEEYLTKLNEFVKPLVDLKNMSQPFAYTDAKDFYYLIASKEGKLLYSFATGNFGKPTSEDVAAMGADQETMVLEFYEWFHRNFKVSKESLKRVIDEKTLERLDKSLKELSPDAKTKNESKGAYGVLLAFAELNNLFVEYASKFGHHATEMYPTEEKMDPETESVMRTAYMHVLVERFIPDPVNRTFNNSLFAGLAYQCAYGKLSLLQLISTAAHHRFKFDGVTVPDFINIEKYDLKNDVTATASTSFSSGSSPSSSSSSSSSTTGSSTVTTSNSKQSKKNKKKAQKKKNAAAKAAAQGQSSEKKDSPTTAKDSPKPSKQPRKKEPKPFVASATNFFESCSTEEMRFNRPRFPIIDEKGVLISGSDAEQTVHPEVARMKAMYGIQDDIFRFLLDLCPRDKTKPVNVALLNLPEDFELTVDNPHIPNPSKKQLKAYKNKLAAKRKNSESKEDKYEEGEIDDQEAITYYKKNFVKRVTDLYNSLSEPIYLNVDWKRAYNSNAFLPSAYAKIFESHKIYKDSFSRIHNDGNLNHGSERNFYKKASNLGYYKKDQVITVFYTLYLLQKSLESNPELKFSNFWGNSRRAFFSQSMIEVMRPTSVEADALFRSITDSIDRTLNPPVKSNEKKTESNDQDSSSSHQRAYPPVNPKKKCKGRNSNPNPQQKQKKKTQAPPSRPKSGKGPTTKKPQPVVKPSFTVPITPRVIAQPAVRNYGVPPTNSSEYASELKVMNQMKSIQLESESSDGSSKSGAFNATSLFTGNPDVKFLGIPVVNPSFPPEDSNEVVIQQAVNKKLEPFKTISNQIFDDISKMFEEDQEGFINQLPSAIGDMFAETLEANKIADQIEAENAERGRKKLITDARKKDAGKKKKASSVNSDKLKSQAQNKPPKGSNGNITKQLDDSVFEVDNDNDQKDDESEIDGDDLEEIEKDDSLFNDDEVNVKIIGEKSPSNESDNEEEDDDDEKASSEQAVEPHCEEVLETTEDIPGD